MEQTEKIVKRNWQSFREDIRKYQPAAYDLALRLLETAEALGATEHDFHAAVEYVEDWLRETKTLFPVSMADVKRHRDAAVEKLGKD